MHHEAALVLPGGGHADEVQGPPLEEHDEVGVSPRGPADDARPDR